MFMISRIIALNDLAIYLIMAEVDIFIHVQIKKWAGFLVINKCQDVNPCCVFYRIYKKVQSKFIYKKKILNETYPVYYLCC